MPYTGETLDVTATLLRLNQAARDHGFSCVSLVDQAGIILPILTRPSTYSNAPRVYISTGMHGDEPAGPLMILDLLEREQFCPNIDWTLFPMLNPAGLRLNQRENHMGIDLNRDYLNPATKEVIAHINYIEEQEPWDLSLIIHEDWESDGFYLYDKPTDLTDGWAKTIVERVRKVCPIDLSEAIDKMSSSEGIISPRFENIKEDPKLKGQWPEAIYLFMTEKVRGSFTFEAPSSYDMPTRIKALETAILTSVELLSTAE